jgi:hypothetical protein
VKKKVATTAASVLSTEAFPTAGLALELEVPTAAVASIPGRKVGEECWNSGLDGRGGSGGQYLPEGGGSQYPARGGGGSHVGGCPAAGDLAHNIMGGGLV